MDLVNAFTAGRVPREMAKYTAGAALVALNKKNGDIRPIAVGEIIRRLVSKCCCADMRSEAAEELAPRQVGVGVAGGGEAVTHTVSAVIHELGMAQDRVMLKVDFKNAFNLVSRQAFIRIIRDKFPHLAHWVEFCYAGQPFLWWDKHVLRSAAGVQQGDPLGPILFSLVLQEVVREIEKQLPDLDLNVWYLDDGTIIGKSAEVAQALQIIEVEGRKLGLELRKDKCELF